MGTGLGPSGTHPNERVSHLFPSCCISQLYTVGAHYLLITGMEWHTVIWLWSRGSNDNVFFLPEAMYPTDGDAWIPQHSPRRAGHGEGSGGWLAPGCSSWLWPQPSRCCRPLLGSETSELVVGNLFTLVPVFETKKQKQTTPFLQEIFQGPWCVHRGPRKSSRKSKEPGVS